MTSPPTAAALAELDAALKEFETAQAAAGAAATPPPATSTPTPSPTG